MSERSYTPRDIFADILEVTEPQAVDWVRGDAVSEQLLWIPYPRKWKLQRYGGKPVR